MIAYRVYQHAHVVANKLLSKLHSELLECHCCYTEVRVENKGVCCCHIKHEPENVLKVLHTLETNVVIASQLVCLINTPMYILYSATHKRQDTDILVPSFCRLLTDVVSEGSARVDVTFTTLLSFHAVATKFPLRRKTHSPRSNR